MKSIIFTILVLITLNVTATTNTVKKIPPEKRGEIYMRKFGGFVVDPKSGQGKIGIINAQSLLPADEIDAVVTNIHKNMKYNIMQKESNRGQGLPTLREVSEAGFNVAIFVIDSPSLPILLVAPEEHWGLINVRKIKEGTNDDALGKRLFALRCRGEIMRGFALTCGAGSSSYPGNMYGVTSASELDTTNVDAIIMDIVQRCGNWLPKIGVTPERKVMYLRACHEGWAPKPQNEYQQAIWDKVKAQQNATPTSPIRILPGQKPKNK